MSYFYRPVVKTGEMEMTIHAVCKAGVKLDTEKAPIPVENRRLCGFAEPGINIFVRRGRHHRRRLQSWVVLH
jgi:hypothetical protein